MDEKTHSYNQICFSVLAYEFNDSEIKDSERKIKRRLKYHRAGTYDQQRVDMMRTLKNDLKTEISLLDKSRYFLGCKGAYSALEDFDTSRMIRDFSREHPLVDITEFPEIMNFALFVYYLR
jgi:hypothetical protein